ncbi:MAG: glutamine--fructose-6-phosphate aminotransferase [Deltaproteobacteria bacterium GWC2_55_46]|nr:MAG: glutamine--fructose-6-phosphate aminotransferase [Deltaproteobacteria bacterium GWA2_55_82]OGQ64085.1 MAG: glutamine--fructose-6-phosphate aminotransferase [Deltaproteobacteria bacterium RIFCSPLOWO2_02_FULL_55_12]OIJ74537.1 MAG: glutamine--fructose-6-phosphate aminotransferase [Deltaproteobacteria bacterium GWC2_55_46]HCY10737.1 glutamine--fructose-6-phosphate transaminase (isomerizing) [Deltaproteobacteria bacterium]
MCGIVGYVGPKDSVEILLEGLKRLEYRGYDSSGIAVVKEGKIELRRSVGKLEKLTAVLQKKPLDGNIGIGHTRWATHGRPSEQNAHPHIEGGVAVVHNGIIENYLALKEELIDEGAKFKSETDTEILSHLIQREIKKGRTLVEAVRAAIRLVKGTYALAAVCESEPDKIVGARMECPLILGVGKHESILSSDIPAILSITRNAIFLKDGEMVVISREGAEITTFDGELVSREPIAVNWSPVMAEKGGYKHFMLKEIFEQPRAITDTFRGIVMEEAGDIFLNKFDIPLDQVKRIYIVACGTSWHAGLVGKSLIESFFKVPTEVDLASEFRYRDPLIDRGSLVISISQSGETADTLAAVKEVKRRGARTISICNVMESSLTREADWSFMTHAGPEIGVASTKAFTTQLTALYLIALYMGRTSGKVDREAGVSLIQELVRLPKKIERVLDGSAEIEALARRYFHYRDFIYLGRGLNFPIALEGALKLKEISYIHAEGYAAGEMKHGPIALIDENMPVVAMAPGDLSYPKMLGNMEEVKARGGRLIAIVSEGDSLASAKADDVIFVPAASVFLTPILMAVPLQLLAYHIAVLKGTDVDQPRNLAKSVTVE